MATIRVQPEDYKDVGDEFSDGYSLALSPYDVPQLIETYYNRPDNMLDISFTYTDDENSVKEMLHSIPFPITVRKGKHSGKILGLSLRIKPTELDNLFHIIKPVLEQARKDRKRFNERANHAVITSILERQQNNIIAGI